MKPNEYEVGKAYPKPDGTEWIFLGYYLDMPVWKVEGKFQARNNIGTGHLPDRSLSKVFSIWKKIFLNQFKALNVSKLQR
jgi:hypothetical protein